MVDRALGLRAMNPRYVKKHLAQRNRLQLRDVLPGKGLPSEDSPQSSTKCSSYASTAVISRLYRC